MFPYMMDLYTVFVENVFGGFWLSVLGLACIMGFILLMGGISPFSIMTFLIIFFFAMSAGYGMEIVSIPFIVAVVIWGLFQVYKTMASSS